MTQDEIIERLREFSPTPDGDWSAFIHLLDALWKTREPQRAYKTLFDLLVRFDDEYMECQWAILHGMEHFGGYETELVASLREKPAHLTVTMFNRIINSGEKTIASVSIESLLEEIIENGHTRYGDFASDCLARVKNGQTGFTK